MKAIERFAEWYAQDSEDREPSTFADEAKVLGVSEATLYRWRNQLTKVDEPESIEAFKKQLYKRAMASNAPAKIMETWAKLQGLFPRDEKPIRGWEPTKEELWEFSMEVVSSLKDTCHKYVSEGGSCLFCGVYPLVGSNGVDIAKLLDYCLEKGVIQSYDLGVLEKFEFDLIYAGITERVANRKRLNNGEISWYEFMGTKSPGESTMKRESEREYIKET
jgi:hypothetical protein